MDPTACLQRISGQERINAECHQAMRDLRNWLEAGGYQPDWALHKLGYKRFAARYGYLVRLPQWELRWAPEGKSLGIVRALDARAAQRMAPKPYRKMLGEIGVERVQG